MKRLWCWERLRAGGEGDDRGWEGWMASLTQWTWVWVDSGSWWRTGKPGVLKSLRLQRGHNLARERQKFLTYVFKSISFSNDTEKAMAPHCSTLAWKIPWVEEPGGLQSMGLLRVGHDWATSLSLFTFMHWRRKWQSTPVFLPQESQEWWSLMACHLWGRTELDTTEAT